MLSCEFISVTNRMIQDYELVPESEKPAGKYSIQKMIISKILDALPDRNWCHLIRSNSIE